MPPLSTSLVLLARKEATEEKTLTFYLAVSLAMFVSIPKSNQLICWIQAEISHGNGISQMDAD